MSDQDTTRQRTARQRKVQTDGRGRSVWTDTIETLELELVSTQTLKAMLLNDDAKQHESIKRAATEGNDGYLVRDNATGHFQIIDDDSLQKLLDQKHEVAVANRKPPKASLEPVKPPKDDEELSLVSTQALRKILGEVPADTPDAPKAPEPDERYDVGGGFDPYNSR